MVFDIRNHVAPVGSPRYDPSAPIPCLPAAKYLGPVELPDTRHKPHYGVVEQSELFGSSVGGEDFDQGTYWYPIKAVTVYHNPGAVHALQAQYETRSTARFGAPNSKEKKYNTAEVKLRTDEYIQGISGIAADYVESLEIHTNQRSIKCGSSGNNPKARPFTYKVPSGHHVVSLYGHASDNYIHGVGVKYVRTIPKVTALGGDEPQPVLDAWAGQMFLTPAMKAEWAAQGAAYREQIREKGSADLTPIYSNVNENGSNAFAWYQIGDEKLLISSSATGMVYNWSADLEQSAVTDAATAPAEGKKAIHLQIGSYSGTANTLGISQYVWTSVPINLTVAILSSAAMFILQVVIKRGLETAAGAASAVIINALVDAGYEGAAALVSGSLIASAGATVLAGALGVAIFFALMALSDFLFKKYYLVVEICNFDPQSDWLTSATWLSDNANISNDTWKECTITKYQPPGPVNTPPPGVYQPITALDGVVTFLTITFENDSTFLQGLGVAFTCSPAADSTKGFSLKYLVHRFSDNELGLADIVQSDLNAFYYDATTWQTTKASSTVVAAEAESISVNASTPALSGASDNVYHFDIEIRPQT